MLHKNWTELDKFYLDKYAKSYVMMEFISLNYEIYESKSENYKADFIAKREDGLLIAIKVKSVVGLNFIQIRQNGRVIKVANPGVYQILCMFEDGRLPDLFLIPCIAWKFPNELICVDGYNCSEKKLEYRLNLTKKNMQILNKYKFDEIVCNLYKK